MINQAPGGINLKVQIRSKIVCFDLGRGNTKNTLIYILHISKVHNIIICIKYKLEAF